VPEEKDKRRKLKQCGKTWKEVKTRAGRIPPTPLCGGPTLGSGAIGN
jgi:hypothetical protein